MRLKKLFKRSIILFIIFILAFFLADGSVNPLMPQSLTKKIAGSSASVDNSLEKIKEIWQKIYRLIAIKNAVNENLSTDNYVKISDIAPDMLNAIVAIEDNRFYRHSGFDIEGIIRAALVNLQSGALVEGGSTITQQLAKNLFLSPERNWLRKTEEVILALDLEFNYSKEEILEMYLNTIYFGSGAYGIGQASAVYFDKHPTNLDLAQCALLAGVPNAPSLNSPYVNLSAAKQRQRLVLDAMAKYGYIEPSLAHEAKDAPLNLSP